MGGYGSKSTKTKGTFYTDSKGYKVKDQHAVIVGEYYINHGKYTVFLHTNPPHKRADLSVEGRHIEVKGLTTLSPSGVAKKIKEANPQVHGDEYRYPPTTWRTGKIVLLSCHAPSVSTARILDAMKKGYEEAVRKKVVDVKV